jgi:hypothetical protein
MMKVNWIILHIAMVLGYCLAVVACGGGSNSATNTTPATPATTAAFSTAGIDECALVSPTDLTRITGAHFANPGSAVGDLCTFVGDGPTQVGIQTYDLGLSAKLIFEAAPTGNNFPILSSPGDEAYWQDLTGAAVLSGHIELTAYVVRPGSGPLDRDASFAVAAAAIAKLPLTPAPTVTPPALTPTPCTLPAGGPCPTATG